MTWSSLAIIEPAEKGERDEDIERSSKLMVAKTNLIKVLTMATAALLAASLLVLVAAGKPAQAAFAGTNVLIAFVSNRDGNDEIYVMKAEPESDNNKPICLTNTPALDEFPAVSPNGKEIAFI